MASRPIFIPGSDDLPLVITKIVEFQWISGMSVSQKRKCIDSLHAAARIELGNKRFLEVSSRSRDDIGKSLSAFNLTFRPDGQKRLLSVECAFQGSKVFEYGGPFTDMFNMSARDAKRDERLKKSGKLIGFHFMGADWPLTPRTAFYDWIYINALNGNHSLVDKLSKFDAFTDIEFNPERSINCQAYSVALFIELRRQGNLCNATASKEVFLNYLAATSVANSPRGEALQGELF